MKASSSPTSVVHPLGTSPSTKRVQQQQQLAEEVDRSPTTTATLCLSRNQFRAYWLLFLLAHVISIQISAATIVINHFLEDGDNGAILNFLGGSPAYFLKLVVLVNWILLAGHAFGLLKMLLFSMYHQQLLFNAPQKNPQKMSSSQSSRSSRKLTSTRFRGLMPLFSSHFGRRGSFGIEGAHYDKVYGAIEVVAVSVRVFQTYKISTWIPRLWVNRLFALLAILSCFSVPLIKLWVPAGLRLKKRVTLLVADAFFDFVTSIWIPTAIATPYVLAYNPASADFPLINYYHDTWFVQAVSENRQAFAVSWVDFLSKNYPKFSYLLAMALIKTCLSEGGSSPSSLHLLDHQVVGPLFKQRSIAAGETVAPTGARLTSVAVKSLKRVPTFTEISAFVAANKTTWRQRFTSRDYWLRNGFFILSGLVVLVIHLHLISATWLAGDRDSSHACLLQMHPWFGSSFECAVVEVHCTHTLISDGYAEDLDAFLSFVRRDAVKSLIFSSCPKLQMPPIIAQFSNLAVIKIYNCTIESWDGQATFIGANHPAVQLVYIVNANMSEVPQGLLSDDLPPMLTDIEFSGTNLTRLPSEISIKWSRLNYFILEGSPGVSEFPAPLTALQIAKMSLSSNNITSIPDEMLSNQIFWMLKLVNNPLQRLPEQIGDVSKMCQFDISHTLVTDLPAWLKTNSSSATGNTWGTNGTHPEVTVDFKAGGSSLCIETEPSALKSKVNPLFQLNCTKDPSMSSEYLYPIRLKFSGENVSTAKMNSSSNKAIGFLCAKSGVEKHQKNV